ncbi:hypothetical protein BC628DRAFT_1336922 [Trametes gibbosa]|nr:hypothetical protein BC628DRAFT_1336922 [Trametes gibbosa]
MYMLRKIGSHARDNVLANVSPVADTSSSSPHGFDLDISGVAGFFGADVAVSAMTMAHIYKGRRWLGWYNQPGSYAVARRYGQLACSAFWDALYPGPNTSPAELCGIDGSAPGPKFMSVLSGSVHAKTSNIAHRFVEGCKALPVLQSRRPMQGQRISSPGSVTVVRLMHESPAEMNTELHQSSSMLLIAALPIIFSLGAAAGCALLNDWFCFGTIMLGVMVNGITSAVIGRSTLRFTRAIRHWTSTNDGAGILDGGDDVIVLRGRKDALTALTRGRFELATYGSAPAYHDLGACAVLLSVQLLAQLLVVPQGELYGQLLFLASLAVSWAHNSYLSAPDLGALLRTIVFERVLSVVRTQREDEEHVRSGMGCGSAQKYGFGTRTGMVVFALLVLAESAEETWPLRRVLDDLLPNDTALWLLWKDEVMRNIEENLHWLRRAVDGDTDGECKEAEREFRFVFPSPQGHGKLLGLIIGDAHAAAEVYACYRR